MPDLGLSSENTYIRHRKRLLALIKELRAVGAHTHLDLPRIVVIGNQSAGKSSLIEAISGVKVPRDAGTCTRCPMECRLLSSAGAWSCQISIRWEFHPNGRRRTNVEEVPFGNVLTEKADVEMMLRRAQVAVLNSEMPLSQILVMDAAELHALSPRDHPESSPFSQNVVCIDIYGPDLADLSFVDLPGIIQNADSHVVRFVEHMVRSYISGTCLIVIALPMSDDIDNQRALRLAREADCDGARTIGVMTKPDTLTAGSIKAKSLWLEILEGRAQNHGLRHGYYCTRQPDDAERTSGITPTEARAAEARFFETTAPWNMSGNRQRFGTKNLVNYLSGMLTDIIDRVLPRLRREVDDKLATCSAELKRIPLEIIGEPAAIVLDLLSSFCGDVKSHVIGISGAEALVQQSRQEYETFKRAIRSTAPRFIPLPSAKATTPDSIVDVLREQDDDDMSSNGTSGAPAYKMYLKDMQDHIKRTRELPFNVPYSAKATLIQRFQQTWERESMSCFEHIHSYFCHTLTRLMHGRFGRFKNFESTIEYVATSRSPSNTVSDTHALPKTELLVLLKFETTPFTQNTHYLSDVTDKMHSKYKDVRGGRTDVKPFPTADSAEEPRNGRYRERLESEALSALAKLGYVGLTGHDLGKLNRPDEYEEELHVMAEVRAYFQVSYKRIIDYIPLAIDHIFFFAFLDGLQLHLIQKLGLGTTDANVRCSAYLSEDPDIVACRKELTGKKMSLEKAKRELMSASLDGVVMSAIS
ncbi:hypothetical protein DAEQUDRAFT_660676 [Daedalea quercina L-15889]|uniref:P-loop containing nucleoside triphosphate hydrolase protein n=1 Tax=Daedalea quercina L-15889 TaxID=1314783 RepID=A0A165U9P0_9APHY|nr:hypothetical protein DAEQUDRAFT_660676 [Daedalea quercina L-15889]